MRAFSLLIVFSFAVACSADDSFTIKLKLNPDVGKTVTYRSVSKDTGSMKFFDAEDKLLNETKKEGDDVVYHTTILERDKDGKATRYLRTYERSIEKENGKTTTLSHQGRTVLIEKVDGKFRVGLVGEPPLDPKDAQKLIKRANRKTDSDGMIRALAAGKPVKVGDSWPIPIKAVVDSLEEMIADHAKSTATAKLVKVYMKDKSQFGTFETVLKLVVTGMEEDGLSMTFDPPAVFEATLITDIAIDASTTERTEKGTMSIKGEGHMKVGATKFRVVFDVTGNGGDENSGERDDPKARVVPKVSFLAAPGEWTAFRPKEGGFKAMFPGAVKEKSSTDKNGIKTTEYSVELGGGREFYSITVAEFPADKIKLNPATVYGNLRKGKDIKSATDIKMSGLPALEMTQEVKKVVAYRVTHRVVVVGSTMYQIMVTAEETAKPDMKKFFDGFQLDKQLKDD
jgi:hypothetical protein